MMASKDNNYRITKKGNVVFRLPFTISPFGDDDDDRCDDHDRGSC